MPYVKPISGHTSCRSVREYLEKGGRALSVDLIGMDPGCGAGWDAQMDETREAYGNDVSVNGRRVRTYNHYVLSPDPADGPTLEQVREFAAEWAERSFPGFQVAIVCHDDSAERIAGGREGILHAHLVVNNTNLDTGYRLAPYLTPAKAREISELAQDMARERGWHGFSPEEHDEGGIRPDEAGAGGAAAADGRRARGARAWSTSQDAYRTREERAMLEGRGWSWKEDLRDCARIAREISSDEGEYARALGAMGVGLGRSARGDYLYTHPGSDTWRVTGMRLGRSFSREGVLRSLPGEDSRGPIRIASERRARVLSALDPLRVTGMRSLGRLEGGMTLRDVADALEANRRFAIRRPADYAARLAAMDPSSPDAAALARARDVTAAIGAGRAPAAMAGKPAAPRPASFDRMTDAEAAAWIARRRQEQAAGREGGGAAPAGARTGPQGQQAQERQALAAKGREAGRGGANPARDR